MPRFIKSELEDAQSLVSDYSFPTTSASSAAALFAFSHGECSTDLLTSPSWCLPGDGSHYLSEIHDGSINHADTEESMFTSGHTTPKGARIAHAHQPVETTWNTVRPVPTSKSQAMSRMSSSTSGRSSVSARSHLVHPTPIVAAAQGFQDDTVPVMGAIHSMTGCQMPESVGSPICWPGYGLDIGLNGDCTLSVEEMNSMNVAPSQVSIGLDGLPAHSPSSTWDVSSSISRTSSPNTIDESWRVAAMANSPMTFMGEPTSPESKPLHLITDVQDTMVPFGGDLNLSANYQQQHSSPESDSPREDHRYKNAVRGADGLFHCPWEGQPGCSHKPEKLKCNYDKYVDSHLKPYKCKVPSCEDARFSSTACRLRHEREAHGLHGHGNKPFLCTHEGCERAQEGNGFPRQWNLRDHMKRVHNDVGDVPAPAPAPAVNPAKGRKRKSEVQEPVVVERKAPTKPAQQQSARKNSTKPLLDEWQDHYQALKGILQGMGGPSDQRNIGQLTEVQNRSVEMSKITSQLLSASNKMPRDADSKKIYNSGD